MTFAYSDIKDNLLGKPRREQYMALLLTSEWIGFRKHLLAQYGHVCEHCGMSGNNESEMSEEEKAAFGAEYRKQFEEFTRRTGKLALWDWLESLQDGTYVGRPALVVGITNSHTPLQIHHKLYFNNKLPWEYGKEYLQILCKDCHEEVHRTTRIYTYQDETMRFRKEEIVCMRCSGTGYLHEYYYHDNGICYGCGGLGLLDCGDPS